MTAIITIIGTLIIVIVFRREIRTGYDEAGRVAAPLRSVVLPFPASYKEILTKYFTYYNQLPKDLKVKFEQKLLYFIMSKKFVPRHFSAVTDEMKVLIGACAVQITFGLPSVYLSHFSRILIYPDNYYSSITKRYHKGEVNPAYGVIVLSWKSFVEGYLVYPTSAINVGLHEMAHALRFENIIRNEEYHFFDQDLIDKFDAYAYKVCHEIDPSMLFFRPYACTNQHEFFSVAVENLFERPSEFKEHQPQLYAILAKLINQDPLVMAASASSEL